MQSSLTAYNETLAEIRLADLHVEQIPLAAARRFMQQYHYSGGLGNAAMPWGAYDTSGRLVGVIAFQTPVSENVRDMIFGTHACGCQLVQPKDCERDDCEIRGAHHHLCDHVTELHRFAVVPEAPENMGSWLISKGLTRLKQYKEQYWAVISLADSTEGHDGTQYQASNADYFGPTRERVMYRDNEGRLRSPRQCGDTITREEAEERGWEVVRRAEKHRYVFWLPYRSMRSVDGLREFANIEIQPYPGSEAEE